MDLIEVQFRPERGDDIAKIAEITSAAFGQADESHLVERIRASTFFVPDLSIVAELAGLAIAHVLLSRIWFRDRNGYLSDVLALAPVSVAPEYQGRGIGSKLIEHALLRATELGYASVILLGHPNYYPRFGFVPSDRFKIALPPFVTDQSAFMIKVLYPARSPSDGAIIYTPAFDDVC